MIMRPHSSRHNKVVDSPTPGEWVPTARRNDAMYAMLKDMPDVATSWWRYYTAMMRATNREMTEFNESCL